MYFSQNLTESTPLSCLDKCACSRRRIYRAYIIPGDSMYSVSVPGIRTATMPPTRCCSISGGSRIWRKGCALGFGGLPPIIFGYSLANLGDFLKNLAKIGRGRDVQISNNCIPDFGGVVLIEFVNVLQWYLASYFFVIIILWWFLN